MDGRSLFHHFEIVVAWKCSRWNSMWLYWKEISDAYSEKFCGVLTRARFRRRYVATCFLYSITAGLSSGVTIISLRTISDLTNCKFRHGDICRTCTFSWPYKFVDYIHGTATTRTSCSRILTQIARNGTVAMARDKYMPLTIVTKRYLSVYLP